MPDGQWHFHCPECGFGDWELGGLATDHELGCEVCREEGRGEVRLQRWEPEQAVPVYARLRGTLVA
jgi:hypothetical protein